MSRSPDLLELLRELNWGDAADVYLISDDCYLVQVVDQLWKLWPAQGSWIEVDLSGAVLGDMHYGAISDFHEKNVQQNSYLPRNHSKKWSKDEKDLLQELIEKDIPIPEIAKKMGRSRRSIVAKSADMLGLNLDHLIQVDKRMDKTIKTLIKIIRSHSAKISIKTKC